MGGPAPNVEAALLPGGAATAGAGASGWAVGAVVAATRGGVVAGDDTVGNDAAGNDAAEIAAGAAGLAKDGCCATLMAGGTGGRTVDAVMAVRVGSDDLGGEGTFARSTLFEPMAAP
jgi:hypothetical protein